MAFNKTLFIILLGSLCYVATIHGDRVETKKQCGKNEEWQDCGTACEPVCNGPKNVPCITLCVAGCFCKPGFIRKVKNGPCICEDDCPPKC